LLLSAEVRFLNALHGAKTGKLTSREIVVSDLDSVAKLPAPDLFLRAQARSCAHTRRLLRFRFFWPRGDRLSD
jgi:hypothetical protein